MDVYRCNHPVIKFEGYLLFSCSEDLEEKLFKVQTQKDLEETRYFIVKLIPRENYKLQAVKSLKKIGTEWCESAAIGLAIDSSRPQGGTFWVKEERGQFSITGNIRALKGENNV